MQVSKDEQWSGYLQSSVFERLNFGEVLPIHGHLASRKLCVEHVLQALAGNAAVVQAQDSQSVTHEHTLDVAGGVVGGVVGGILAGDSAGGETELEEDLIATLPKSRDHPCGERGPCRLACSGHQDP